MKLLTSGGLGDAAMSFAKAEALGIDRKEYKIYHARIREDKLDNPIVDFYSSQGIDSEILRLPVNNDKRHLAHILDDWLIENKDSYDHYLGTHWSSNNGGDSRLDSWEINPCPKVYYTKIEDIDIIINPSSGGVSAAKKEISKDDFCDFMNAFPETAIIGKGEETFDEYINNYYNKTNMFYLINLIASSNIVITPEGFTAYFAAMSGKKVFVMSQNIGAIHKRKHPDWDMHIVDNLKEIVI